MNLSGPYKKVCAIVVTYNALKWIRKCLGSLASSQYPVKIIVIDNGSTDGTRDIIENEFPQTLLLKSQSNLGFGKANNLGLKQALKDGGDYFLLLNHDAWIEEKTIENLVTACERNPTFGIISPLHFAGSGKNFDAGFLNYTKSSTFPHDELISDLTDPSVYEIDFVNAAAWMISKSCLEKVGGFGYIYPHYGEDRDFIQRVKYYGFKIGFVTNTKIFHDREGRSFDFGTVKKMLWYYYTGSLVRISDINKSFVGAWAYTFIWFSRDLVYHFFKGKFHAAQTWIWLLLKILIATPRLLTYRKYIKTQPVL